MLFPSLCLLQSRFRYLGLWHIPSAGLESNIGQKKIAKYGRAQRPREARRRPSDESAMFRPTTLGNPFVRSIEYRECDSGHLFEGLSIRLEAGHGSHPVNCHHEKPSQRGRVLLGRHLPLLLRSPERPNKDRLDPGLVVLQKVPDHCILRVALQLALSKRHPGSCCSRVCAVKPYRSLPKPSFTEEISSNMRCISPLVWSR